jgi:hypothetical protein
MYGHYGGGCRGGGVDFKKEVCQSKEKQEGGHVSKRC